MLIAFMLFYCHVVSLSLTSSFTRVWLYLPFFACTPSIPYWARHCSMLAILIIVICELLLNFVYTPPYSLLAAVTISVMTIEFVFIFCICAAILICLPIIFGIVLFRHYFARLSKVVYLVYVILIGLLYNLSRKLRY